MCRNITVLRGLEPAATPEEVTAAARQYVRKVSGVQATSKLSEAAFELAVRRVTEATADRGTGRRQPRPPHRVAPSASTSIVSDTAVVSVPWVVRLTLYRITASLKSRSPRHGHRSSNSRVPNTP